MFPEFCNEDKLGNDICDPDNNVEKCGYDHGDCVMDNLHHGSQLPNGSNSKPFLLEIDEDFELSICLWNDTTDTA